MADVQKQIVRLTKEYSKEATKLSKLNAKASEHHGKMQQLSEQMQQMAVAGGGATNTPTPTRLAAPAVAVAVAARVKCIGQTEAGKPCPRYALANCAVCEIHRNKQQAAPPATPTSSATTGSTTASNKRPSCRAYTKDNTPCPWQAQPGCHFCGIHNGKYTGHLVPLLAAGSEVTSSRKGSKGK